MQPLQSGPATLPEVGAIRSVECYPPLIKMSATVWRGELHDLELLAGHLRGVLKCKKSFMPPDVPEPAYLRRSPSGRRRPQRTGANAGSSSIRASTFRPEVIELAEAVDQYKLRHRRRFITFEELYDVIAELGYQK